MEYDSIHLRSNITFADFNWFSGQYTQSFRYALERFMGTSEPLRVI